MAMPHTLAVEVIQSIPGYVSQIQAIYGTDKVSLDHITDAIAAYEETLVTPNSPFDRWLRGDDKAMTAEQIAGLKIFLRKRVCCLSQWAQLRWEFVPEDGGG